MPLNSAMVGRSTDWFEHHVDARWTMAYAASLRDFNPLYLDTDAQAVIAHPIFPVCLEWPPILATRALANNQHLSDAEARRGIHAAHDLHLLKPIRANTTLRTRATMIAIKKIAPGAAYTMRLDSIDENDDLVCRTYQLSIYRDVDVTGGDQQSEDLPTPPVFDAAAMTPHGTLSISAGDAHTYTECARIFNPIHTDRAVALAAGLPDIILHGTATLAFAVSALVNKLTDGHPERVKRIGGRFAAMVPMPNELVLQVSPTRADPLGSGVGFQVLNQAGETAISRGFFTYA
ncbi:MAG TPA: hypothetical protein DER02_11025 [Gammaproteobacteria bacterium]|nr:hypothetical protein [Gammaproteobacteria bacterium]|tara:strand:+ start:881 stop:1750 length:870 start_codon:yes stop_codon:yes gene_type:complete